MTRGGRGRHLPAAGPATAAALVAGLLTASPLAQAQETDCGALGWDETAPGSGVWTVPDAAHLSCLSRRTDVRDPLGLSYLQTAAIDLTDRDPWVPIGTAAPEGGFWGAYDGDEHPITGLVVDLRRDGDVAAGLFGVVDATGLLQDVVVQGADVRVDVSGAGSAAAGVVAGASDGQLVGVRASGTVTVAAADGRALAGGVVGVAGRGRASASVTASGADVAVSTKGRTAVAGGLVGYAGTQGAVIDGSRAAGDVTATGGAQTRAGGLVGEAAMATAGGVTGSQATGRVRAEARSDGSASDAATTSVAAGGLVGMAYVREGGVSGSAATGEVAAVGPTGSPATVDAGGLVGWNQAEVTQSYAAGAVRGAGSDTVRAGGLVGYHFSGQVAETYALGDVSVDAAAAPAHAWAGGLVGVNGFGDGTQVRQSYAAGRVSGPTVGDDHLGGLVGGRGSATVAASFWDRQTSGVDPASPADPAAAGTPATTAELAAASTYVAAGWSLAPGHPVPAGTAWGICDGTGRPFLAWQRFDADPCATPAAPADPIAAPVTPAAAVPAAPATVRPSASPSSPVTGVPTPATAVRAASTTPSALPSSPEATAASDTPAASPTDVPESAVVIATPVDGSAVSSGGWFAVTARTRDVAEGTDAFVTVDGVAVAATTVAADGTARFVKVPSRVGEYRVRIGPAPAVLQSSAFALDVKPFAISYATTHDGKALVTVRTGNWYRGQVLQLTRDGRTTATVRVGAPGKAVTLVVPAAAGDYQVKAQSRQGTVYGMAAGALRLR